MTASIQPRLGPHEAFWIPMLIRSTPKPAPVASPTRDATAQHPAPLVAYAAPCVVPANDAEGRAVADADAATVAATEPAAGRSTPCEPSLAAIRPSSSDEADLAKSPAVACRPPVPLEERGDGVTALLMSLALAAVAVAILNMPGLADKPVAARDRLHVLSDMSVASASDLVPETQRAGGRPGITPPAAGSLPCAADPALVAHDRAPTESVEVPAACGEAIVAATAPPSHTSIASETLLCGEYVQKDMAAAIGSIVSVGENVDRPAGAAAIDVIPALEAAPEVKPEVSTSASRHGSRPPRGREKHRRKRAGVVVTPVIPTSRDLLDEPVSGP